MKVLVAYATRYGSTKQVAEWMAAYLRTKGAVDLCTVDQVCSSLDEYTHLLLGSPLYDDDLLPEMQTFIRDRDREFAGKSLGIFGVALDQLGRGLYGSAEGGRAFFDRFFEYLPVKPVYSRFLGGALYPERLNDKDRRLVAEFFELHGSREIPHIVHLEEQEVIRFVDKFLHLAEVKERLREKMKKKGARKS